MPNTEAKLEKAVVAHCKKRGLYCRKMTGLAGMPDRLIAGGGKVLFLELKAPGNKPTPLQEREMRLLRVAGHTATWAFKLEQAVEIIDDHFATTVVEDIIG